MPLIYRGVEGVEQLLNFFHPGEAADVAVPGHLLPELLRCDPGEPSLLRFLQDRAALDVVAHGSTTATATGNEEAAGATMTLDRTALLLRVRGESGAVARSAHAARKVLRALEREATELLLPAVLRVPFTEAARVGDIRHVASRPRSGSLAAASAVTLKRAIASIESDSGARLTIRLTSSGDADALIVRGAEDAVEEAIAQARAFLRRLETVRTVVADYVFACLTLRYPTLTCCPLLVSALFTAST